MPYDCYKNTVKATTFNYAKGRLVPDSRSITKETIRIRLRSFLLVLEKTCGAAVSQAGVKCVT